MLTPNDYKSAWLASRGFVSNDLNTQWAGFLNSASGNGSGQSADLSLQDAWRLFLKNHGNTEGSFTDMYKQELIRSIGGSANSTMSVSDLEIQFFSSTANTFA